MAVNDGEMDSLEEAQLLYRWDGVVAVAGAPTQEPLPRMLEVYPSVRVSRPLPLPVVHIGGDVVGYLDSVWLRPQLDRSIDIMASGGIRMTAARHAELIAAHGGAMTVAADISDARTTLLSDGGDGTPALLLMSGWVLAAVTVGGTHPAWPERTGIHVHSEPMSQEQAEGNPLETVPETGGHLR